MRKASIFIKNSQHLRIVELRKQKIELKWK